MPPREWNRIRPLLESEDTTHHAQAVELLASMGDPRLYDLALRRLRLSPVKLTRHPMIQAHLLDLPLTSLRTDHSFLRDPLCLINDEAALRLLADAPAASRRALPLRSALTGLCLHPLRAPPRERSHLDLSPLRRFPTLRWLEVLGARAVLGAAALDELPALERLSLLKCEDLQWMRGLRLERLERLLLAGEAPLPARGWERLERLVIVASGPVDLAPIADFSGLRVLQVDAWTLRDAAAIGEHTALEELAVNIQAGAYDLGFLRRLSALRRLSLFGGPPEPEELAQLPGLEEMTLTSLPGMTLDLGPLQAADGLRSLTLDTLTGTIKIRLSQPVPQVDTLRLIGTRFADHTDAFWSFLNGFIGLRRVVLENWNVSDPALWKALSRLPWLEELVRKDCARDVRLPRALARRVRVVA